VAYFQQQPCLTVGSELPTFWSFMSFRVLYLIPCLAVLLPESTPAQSADSGSLRSGTGEARDSADAAGAAEAYATALASDQAGNRSQALGQYRQVARQYPFAREGGNALFRSAQLLQEAGETTRAFDAFNDYIMRYPDSDRFEQAILSQLEIANLYLEGKRVRFLGLPLASGYERAQEMYTKIVANAPFSKYAPMAQFNLGLAYERQGKPFEAVRAYQVILDRYPASAVADDALYQTGYVYMQVGASGGSEDLSSLIQAKNTFEDFLLQFPQSEKVSQAEENLRLLSDQETTDISSIARFYDRSRNYRAAFLYYNEVIRRDPSSEEAELAKIRIEELRGDHGDDALRTGPDRAETGERVALRRRLQSQVETPALADYAGPPRSEIAREELPVVRPRLRTQTRDVAPLPPVEPDLPTP